MTNDNDSLVYSVSSVASLLHLSVNNLYAQLKAGNIPHLKCGKRYIIPKKALNDWLATAMTKAPASK